MSKEIIRPSQFARVEVNQENLTELNEDQKNVLGKLYEETFKKFDVGKILKGSIVSIGPDGVVIDISYKSNGTIPRYEFTDYEYKKLKPNDELEVIISELESIDGTVSLSYEKAKALRAWDEINKFFEEDKPVQGIVTHKVKGGLSVDIGVSAFLPGSQVDVQRVSDFDQFVGQNITAYIIKVNKKRGNVIISRRKYLAEQRSEARKKILDTLEEGQVIQGIVKNITNYGAFIDIGGVDGLLHITDMTWGRISHPSELVRLGDQITVKVLSFDKDNEKISLGIKQLSENPWESLSENITPGSKIKGKITNITDYGLFIEIAKNVEGLIHISEISWTDKVNDLKRKYQIGNEIEVLVVSLDKDNRRMSLSLKQLEKNPWETVKEKFEIGQKIKGKINNITDFGIFVELLPGIDGLVHVSDISWTQHVEHPQDLYKKSEEVEAIILSIEPENKKIALGVKQLTKDPWSNIEKEYKLGEIIKGIISKIANFGAFVKLPSGIEGLIHISELPEKTDKIEDVLKVGDKKEFRVIKINKDERKLGLSLKLKDEQRRDEKKITRKAKDSEYRAPKKSQSEPKSKSLLQIELEKHLKNKN